jgi:hypothetical protein
MGGMGEVSGVSLVLVLANGHTRDLRYAAAKINTIPAARIHIPAAP